MIFIFYAAHALLEHSPFANLALSKEVYVCSDHITFVTAKITYLKCAIGWEILMKLRLITASIRYNMRELTY
ncbi:hypothetical protein SMBr_16310 [Shewanella sp. M-Br]|nr:hypothetical protein SMBr_16310 [Shewanella sp. M-Br]